jgi:predicted metal-dependent hydrolase
MPEKDKHLAHIIEKEELPVPLYVYLDRGKSVRIRLKENKAVLSVPIFIPENERKRYIEWALDWVHKKTQKERFQNGLQKRVFTNGDTLTVMERPLHLQIQETQYFTQKANAKATRDNIIINLPFNWDDAEKQDAIRSLLRTMLAKICHSPMQRRVDELNNQHFKFDVQQIRLKYNKSNWGSCSTKGNLNFSIRLLFAPQKVIDSVILHELVHFKHMNHSNEFWQMLQKHDPHLEHSEAWLKAHSYTDFV